MLRSFNSKCIMPLFACPTNSPKVHEITLTDPCFISDLHLNSEDHGEVEAFKTFLDTVAEKRKELVILGDFFDYWVGDDALFTAKAVIEPLKQFSQTHSIYFMHGNRDFMVSDRLMHAMGATLLADPTIARYQNQTLLLSHGDLWCTKDVDYQKLRRKVRSVWWQWLMLRFPLKKRLSIAHNARMKSRTQKNNKKAEEMDVEAAAVIEAARLTSADMIIHGHTHRPGQISLTPTLSRYVLGDWRHQADGHFGGSCLVFEEKTPVYLSF